MSDPDSARPLGQWLLSRRLISPAALENALHRQRLSGGRLGEILCAHHWLSPQRLFTSLAVRAGRPYADLQRNPPEEKQLIYHDLSDYLAQHYIPMCWQDGALCIASSEPDRLDTDHLARRYQAPIHLFYCTPRDIRMTLERRFSRRLVQETRTRMQRELPDFSALLTLTYGQRLWMILAFTALAVAFVAWPVSMVIGSLIAMNGLYLLTVGFKLLLYRRAERLRQKQRVPSAQSHAWRMLEEASLPVYSILIPLYREAESVPRLLDAIRALDYPRHKLDVKLVIEADDNPTLRAIERARPEPFFDIIRVPAAEPRTKPKACSYALNFARGEYLTIYDAEDMPEPAQLKKAVAAFRHAPENVICLQARLNYYNWHENMLSRCFAIEYASLFDWMLPALQSLHIPIPLGGTSNHIDLRKLHELRGWDPYNVTEDADLGIRLTMCGYRTQMLNSLTLEEAPIRFMGWLKQRSRWIKGYMQTWLVYMRHPLRTYRRLGHIGFWGFQFIIGIPCMVFFISPFFLFFGLLWLIGVFEASVKPALLLLCYTAFATGYCCHFLYALACIRRWKWPGMASAAFIYPFYWLCHSLASLRAAWQLIRRPHFWDKTQHSQTRVSPLAFTRKSKPKQSARDAALDSVLLTR